VGESWLHEAVSRQIPEVWPNIASYIVTVFKHRDNVLVHRPSSFYPLKEKTLQLYQK
jgi:hypothetical protein